MNIVNTVDGLMAHQRNLGVYDYDYVMTLKGLYHAILALPKSIIGLYMIIFYLLHNGVLILYEIEVISGAIFPTRKNKRSVSRKCRRSHDVAEPAGSTAVSPAHESL